MERDNDIPASCTGDYIFVLAEMDGGPHIISGESIDLSKLIVYPKKGPLKAASELDIRATIYGLSDNAVEQLVSAVNTLYDATDLFAEKRITRRLLMQALGASNN